MKHQLSFAIFIFILFPFILSAQFRIQGRVLDDQTGEPLSNTSVYVNNTTIGTTTNEMGEYLLPKISPGVYEIIVSHLGFETIVHRVTVDRQDLRFAFRLSPKAEEMHEILVVSSTQRKRWLKIMKDYFLGLTVAATHSKILNENDISFEKTNSRNHIKAYSLQPLEIENRELGYRIFFDLKEFFYDDSLGLTTFYGFSRFEELKESKQGPSRKYQRLREATYKGSTLHFYQSLLDHSLAYEGFSVYLTKDVDTTNYRERPNEGGTTGKVQPITASMKLAIPVTGEQILFTDSVSGKKYLDWDGTLTVRYSHDPYYKQALRNRVLIDGNLPKGFQSFIKLLGSPVYLDENGVVENPLLIEYGGFWSYEKLANMLPVNYRPGVLDIRN